MAKTAYYAKGSSSGSSGPVYAKQTSKSISDDFFNEEDDTYPVSEDGKYVSEEVYWEEYYEHPDFNYEWNNGILEEKPMPNYGSSEISRWVQLLIEEYLNTYSNAKYITMDIGFKLQLPGKTSIRKPDRAIILNSNKDDIDLDDRSYKGTYDLCIEYLSDSTRKEKERDTIHKKREYRQANVKEYYIIDHKKTETAFYRLDKNGYYRKIKPDKNGVIKSKVLPGFQFRESDLYDRPSLSEMAKDNVYKSFVKTDYQEAVRKNEEKDELINEKNQLIHEKDELINEKNQLILEQDQLIEKERKKSEEMAAKIKELEEMLNQSNK